jgi:solute carrier family 25 carnitine/acylcarnitine transporter 20/29
MRFYNLPWPLLSLALAQEQLPLQYDTTRTTLTDVLSANAHFSSLLRLLQRSRLIPTLNRLSNATLFAPTNAALAEAGFDDGDLDLTAPDNIQAALRRQLLYHLLNYTLPLSNDTSQPTQLIETLLFPHPKAGHGKPGWPDLPDEHSLLGGEGQKLKLAKDSNVTTLRANGKAAQVMMANASYAGNGLVLPIDRLLSPPKSISHALFDHPSLSQIRSLYSEAQLREYATRPNLTLFVPIDTAWEGNALDELEWRYLRSGFAEKDLLELFQNHAASNTIGYANRLEQEKKGMFWLLGPLRSSCRGSHHDGRS